MSILLHVFLLASTGTTPTTPAEPLAVTFTAPSLTQDEAAEKDTGWKGSFTLGGILSTGNSDTRNANAGLDAKLEREKDRWTTNAWWNYSSDGDGLQQRRYGSAIQYDYFANEKLYYLGQTSVETDFDADLQRRSTAGGGLGYQWKKDKEFSFATEGGLSWFYENYEEEESNDFLALRLAYNLGWEASERLNLTQSFTIFPSLEDNDDVYSKLETKAKLSMTERMFAQFHWVWDWDNTPKAGDDKSSHNYVLSVGWNF